MLYVLEVRRKCPKDKSCSLLYWYKIQIMLTWGTLLLPRKSSSSGGGGMISSSSRMHNYTHEQKVKSLKTTCLPRDSDRFQTTTSRPRSVFRRRPEETKSEIDLKSSLEEDIHFWNFWWVRGDEITVVMITWISHHRRSWIIMVVMCAAAPRLIWGPRGSCPGSHPQICKSCLLNIFQKEWKIICRHIHESRDISLLLDYFGFCTKWLFPHFSPLKIMPQATKKWIYIFLAAANDM